MKKLMIAAAAAAMIGGSFADVAQVYDVKLNVKTTACKTGKFTAALEKLLPGAGFSKGDSIQYRKQANRTIEGVIWGCDCVTIADPAWRAYTRQNAAQTKTTTTIGGYQFWDSTGKLAIPFYVPYTRFSWAVLNRIDQMTKVEGAWELLNGAEGQGCDLQGAGFGTCKNVANDCDSYITSMNGSFAGLMQYESGDGDGCVFCGETEFDCLVLPFCFCNDGEIDTTALTVAYGTWTLKYNSAASKKLKTTYYITAAKNFNTAKLAVVGASLDAAEYVALTAAGSVDQNGNPVHVVTNDADINEWGAAEGTSKNAYEPVEIDKDEYFEMASDYVAILQAKFKNLDFDFVDPGESPYFPLDEEGGDEEEEEEPEPEPEP